MNTSTEVDAQGPIRGRTGAIRTGIGTGTGTAHPFAHTYLHDMPQESAGILLYRPTPGALQVLLVHFGGPFWRKRDAGAWSIPKGLIEPGEDAERAARREFEEELGSRADGPLRHLCRIRQRAGKWVDAFAMEGDLDADAVVSNTFTQEWPPGSGRMQSFPEVDRARWFTLDEARTMMLPSQLPILDSLERLLAAR